MVNENFSVTQNTENHLILPREFYRQLQNWILDVEQELQSLRSLREQLFWNQIPQTVNQLPPSAPNGGQLPENIVFPFQVIFKNSGPHLPENAEDVIVCGSNTVTGHETESIIFAGPGDFISFRETVLSVSGEGDLYLIVDLDNSSENYLSARVEFLRSAPVSSTTAYVVLLAGIRSTPCGFMKIIQLHSGHVYISGRIV